MNMTTVHLVTGATGFVGGALVLELLQRTDDVVLCGVRDSSQSGQHRLLDALRHAAAAYDVSHLAHDIERRCIAFRLDLEEEPRPDAVPNVSGDRIFWHAAASLRYEERYRDQIFRDNVDGTRRMLDLASAVGAKRFNYISTAYVAGTQEGEILEVVPEDEVATSNCYEISKIAAERLVWGAQGCETRILRPSIVIGHSRTLAATSFTGFYGFIREMRTFERKVEHRLGKILSMRPLSFIMRASALINLIPIDLVARDAVAVGMAETASRVFHLTNEHPPVCGDTLDTVFEELRLPRPLRVESSRAFTSLDQTLNDHLAFYASYMDSRKLFSRANTDAIVGAGAGRFPIATERTRAFARWYLDRAGNDARTRNLRSTQPVTTEIA
jgi:nucleoside-diphosphate-sugar epimerase